MTSHELECKNKDIIPELVRIYIDGGGDVFLSDMSDMHSRDMMIYYCPYCGELLNKCKECLEKLIIKENEKD